MAGLVRSEGTNVEALLKFKDVFSFDFAMRRWMPLLGGSSDEDRLLVWKGICMGKG